MPESLTVDQAAALLGIPPQDLLLSRARGVAPGTLGYRQGGQVLWDPAELEAFIPKPKAKPKTAAKAKTQKKS